jgi:translation initiation factor IF-2
MFNDKGEIIADADPSAPVAVLGFSEIPLAGDEFIVTPVEAQAKELAEYRKVKSKEKEMLMRSKTTMENMFSNVHSTKINLSIILKMDVAGSGEAIIGILEKLNNEKVNVKVVHSAVGGINESDVNLARSTDAIIVAFNVRANGPAKDLAKAHEIEIRYYSVIYNILDDVKAILEGKLDPILSENFIGYADVLQTFKVGKSLTVAGCRVSDGVVKRNCKCRIIRNDVVIYEGDLGQLKHGKDDVREATNGTECGISFAAYNDLQVDDKIECFEVVKTAAKL